MSVTELATLSLVVCGLFLMAFIVQTYERRALQRTIDRQNDTIQRLINREPVTYAEVGTNPSKPVRERYAAWGAQMVNLDEDESRS
jgi:hypothetical protein